MCSKREYCDNVFSIFTPFKLSYKTDLLSRRHIDTHRHNTAQANTNVNLALYSHCTAGHWSVTMTHLCSAFVVMSGFELVEHTVSIANQRLHHQLKFTSKVLYMS